MKTKERITQSLQESFHPTQLEVVDESHLHKGHAGARPEGETHFRIRIVAQGFIGKGRLAIHREINEALASELQPGIVHAFAIEAKAPEHG